MALALAGVKILTTAITSIAEFCTMILGDFGADVIKVEYPGQKLGRGSGMSNSPVGEKAREEAAYKAINRNKKSLTLNLKADEGRKIFLQLAEKVDIIIESFRPGVVNRLGIDYETISQVNPRIVYCSISGYGQYGCYRDMVGHDPNYIAIGGALGLIGERNGKPVFPLNLVGDWAGGTMHATIGILLALMARERTGKGQYIDISITDAVINLMLQYVQPYFRTGVVPKRGESVSNGALPCYAVYETKDKKFISIGCLEPQFWENLCCALGREDLATTQNAFARGDKGNEVINCLHEIFVTKTRDEWFNYLKPKDVCIAPVYELDEVFNDPHVLERQMVVEVEGPDNLKAKQIGVAIKLSDTPGTIRSLAPILGENTNEILLSLGYTQAEIEVLRKTKII